MELKTGDKAPDFKSTDQNGNTVTLKDFRGQKVILYFYPRDLTPTCTVEACNLRDNQNVLQKKGFVILGVSADSEESHQKFAAKHQLPFTLIADTDKSIVNKYGVWKKKKLYGREYMGIQRTTFVIDEQGRIERIFDKVKAKEHAAQILKSYN